VGDEFEAIGRKESEVNGFYNRIVGTSGGTGRGFGRAGLIFLYRSKPDGFVIYYAETGMRLSFHGS
jgi:hypothetical protein